MKPKLIRPRYRKTQLIFAALLCSAPGIRAITVAEWRYSQTLDVSGTGLTRVELPVATLNAARPALDDLRILDSAGNEVPYLIERAVPQPGLVRRAKEFHSTMANDSTAITLETGMTTPLVGVSLETPAGIFIKAVRVEASHDNANWQMLADGAALFRQPGGAEKLQIPLPQGTWEFLRLTIDDRRTQPVPFTGASLHTPGVPADSRTQATTISSRDENPGETRLVLEFGGGNLPLASLKIETPEPLFTRTVTFAVPAVTEEGIREKTIGRGVVYRIGIGGRNEAKLDIPIGLQIPSRELILFILNEDSPPLAVTAVQAERRLTRLVFYVRESGLFSILTGNSECAAPHYDMSEFAGQLKDLAANEMILPPQLVENPAFKAPEALASLKLTGAAIDVADWKFRKPVQLSRAGVQQVELDLETLSGATADLRDLRLVQEGRQIPFLVDRPSISRKIALDGAPVSDPKRPSLSRWKFKLPHSALPVDRFVCSSTSPLFQRDMRLVEELTDDRGDQYLRELGRATWRQTPGLAQRDLLIPFTATPSTNTLILETENGDNPGIDLHEFRCFYSITRLVFKAASESSQPLWLYYGNQEAPASRYDLSLIAEQILRAEKSAASLGRMEIIKGGKGREEELNGHGGALFWAVLAVVVMVLLALVSRLLPKTTTPRD